MKLKTKNKGILVLRFLLMMCWSVVGHRILNKYVYDELLTTSVRKRFDKVEARKTYMVDVRNPNHNCTIDPNSGAPMGYVYGNYCNPDVVDKYRHHVDTSYSTDHKDYDILKKRAKYYILKARDYYNSNDDSKAAFYLGYGLHYVQDAAAPPHAGGHSGFYHTNYEGAGDNDSWSSSNRFNIKCSSHSNCAIYNDPDDGAKKYLSDALTTLNSNSAIKNARGEGIFSVPALKTYIGTTRWKKWKDKFDIARNNGSANDYKIAKRHILWDLAVAMHVQEKYLKSTLFID